MQLSKTFQADSDMRTFAEPRINGLKLSQQDKARKQADGSWTIPSSDGTKRYVITTNQDGSGRTCECPDHMNRGRDCKHILEVNRRNAIK